MIRPAFLLVGLLSVLLPASAALAEPVTHEDYRIFRETQTALKDERLQTLPEDQRVSLIAKRNFKMKGPDLQAILDRVDAAGGFKGIEAAQQKAVREVLQGTPVGSRVTEVSIETGAELVITYVSWTLDDPKKLDQESALLALKAAAAAPVTSTLVLTARNAAGQPLWRGKIDAERTQKIKEERIADWASTRYIKLFEVDPNVHDASLPAEPAAP